jgi:hypothetical protein
MTKGTGLVWEINHLSLGNSRYLSLLYKDSLSMMEMRTSWLQEIEFVAPYFDAMDRG